MEKFIVTGELAFGYFDTKTGVVHRAFTMRALTFADMERMEDEHPELMASANTLTLRRLAFAYALESLGTLPRDAITPNLLVGLLEGLPAQDYAALAQAEDELTKKLRAAYGRGGQDAS